VNTDDQAPNDRKIADQLDWLARVRSSPAGVKLGWGDGELPPSTARALERAGLVRVDPAARTAFATPHEN